MSRLTDSFIFLERVREKAAESEPRSRRLPAFGWILSAPYLAFLILPLLALLIRAPAGQIWENLHRAEVYQAIRVSLITSTAATLTSILLCTPLAFALARQRFRFKNILDTLIDLPTVLPPAVAGLILLMAFGRRGLVGEAFDSLGFQIGFTPLAVVLAQTFIAAPFYIKAAKLGFANIDIELEQAAALDGASGWQVFRYVTIPLSWSALVGGSVVCWARAIGEFGATIIFAGNLPGRTQTMPLAIYLGFELDLDIALTLSVILVGFSFLALMTIKGLLHREWI
jgi:molybdate transport system permease protein